jgi:hypothetical protein
MMMYDVQIDAESRKLAPYTDPLKRPKGRKCIYGALIKALDFGCPFLAKPPRKTLWYQIPHYNV